MWNNEERCMAEFNHLEQLAKQCDTMKFKIQFLKCAVQNPKDICTDNFDEIIKFFMLIKNDMDKINEELKNSYNSIYDIYYVG